MDSGNNYTLQLALTFTKCWHIKKKTKKQKQFIFFSFYKYLNYRDTEAYV